MMVDSLNSAIITIITPTYNSSKFLGKCITSLHGASMRVPDVNLAHLVVDGYSTDTTLDIIQKISPLSIIVQRKPIGIYDALNYGVSLVQSPYVMYLHSDDEIDEYFFVEMMQAIKSSCKGKAISRNIFYGTVDFIDPNSQYLYSRKPPYYIHFFQKYTSMIFHPNAVYSTMLEKHCPYDMCNNLSADQSHITQIAKMAKLIRVPRSKYRFRLSLESSSVKQNLNRNEVYHEQIVWKLLANAYIKLFENHLFKRLALKILANRTYCTSP